MSGPTLEYSHDPRPGSSRLRRLFGRGFWTLFDQGVVSAGNFFNTVLPGRTASRAEYGVFAILFGVMLMLNNLHMSLVTYQISVRGGANDDKNALRKSVANGLLTTLLLALPFAIPIAVACVLLHRTELIGWTILASITWQLQETTRRGLMAHLRFSTVVGGDAVSFLGKAGLIFALSHFGQLDIVNMLIAMSVTSLAGFVIQLWQLGFVPVGDTQFAAFLRTSWDLGRWLLLNNLLFIVNIQAISWVTAASHGVAEAAQLQAIANVLGLTHPVLMGISSIIIPATARSRAKHGMLPAMRSALTYAGMGAALLAPVYLVIAIAPGFVLWAFYADNYIDSTMLLRLMVLVYAIDFFGWMISALLSGLEQNRGVFLASLATTVATLAITLPMTLKFGVTGALIGAVISVAARVIAGGVYLNKLRRADLQTSDKSETLTPPLVV